MIDFHAHILPGIDDGAQDVKMSLDMLHESFTQGVTTVVATPHCYLMNEKDIDVFLKMRENSYNELKKAMKEDGREFPEIKLGCELRILSEIPHMSKLNKLAIEGTNYILVEMPYKKWDVNSYDFLYALILRGMRPIVAHIERFWNQRREFYNLYSLDLVYQVNADAFICFRGRKRLSKLFSSGAVHIVGSDMHNTTNRKTCMKKATDTMIKIYGKDRYDFLMDNAYRILENEGTNGRTFEKRGLFY